MRTKIWSAAMGALMISVGCSQAPTAPSSLAIESSSAALGATSETTYSQPVVTLLPDLTVSPSQVTVRAGYRVRMVNNSGRAARIHSYNCSEFTLMALPAGYSKNTLPFSPAGKTCDYFVWETDWSRKIFVGQVIVQ
jgi:hypothetical protein